MNRSAYQVSEADKKTENPKKVKNRGRKNTKKFKKWPKTPKKC